MTQPRMRRRQGFSRCAALASGKRIGAGGRNVPIASDAVMRRFRSDP
ncbi:hypothetical protein BURPS668_1140 [Burkholderia pseudomallei 668]|nr:hypothetical protein BURPS668_1140 [Burkholderia pseudomallei 668]